MGQGILLSAETEVDFMIHGVFSYELFGQTVWITTTHICVLIVMLIIIGFCIAANRAMKKHTKRRSGSRGYRNTRNGKMSSPCRKSVS